MDSFSFTKGNMALMLLGQVALSTTALAGRTLVIPPFERRMFIEGRVNGLDNVPKQYWNPALPAPANDGVGTLGTKHHDPRLDDTPTSAYFAMGIYLSNVSQNAQSGTLKLLSGTKVVVSQRDRAGTWPFGYYLCGNTVFGGPIGLSPAVPSSTVSWSIPAASSGNPAPTTYLEVGILVRGTYQKNPAAGGQRDLSLEFAPSVQIDVNENQGAILGVVNHLVNNPVPNMIHCAHSSNPAYNGNSNLRSTTVGPENFPDDQAWLQIPNVSAQPFALLNGASW